MTYFGVILKYSSKSPVISVRASSTCGWTDRWTDRCQVMEWALTTDKFSQKKVCFLFCSQLKICWIWSPTKIIRIVSSQGWEMFYWPSFWDLQIKTYFLTQHLVMLWPYLLTPNFGKKAFHCPKALWQSFFSLVHLNWIIFGMLHFANMCLCSDMYILHLDLKITKMLNIPPTRPFSLDLHNLIAEGVLGHKVHFRYNQLDTNRQRSGSNQFHTRQG